MSIQTNKQKNSRALLVFISIKHSSRRYELKGGFAITFNQLHERICIGSIPKTVSGFQNYFVIYDCIIICRGN